jgi:hypothetical protein
MNRTLRFNHLNTRLSNEITDHYAKAGMPAEPEFIEMLGSHHESEGDRMLRRRGTEGQRPDPSLLGTKAGFGYYDTDANQMIVWNGSGWTLPIQTEESLHYYASGAAASEAGEIRMKRMEGHPTQEYIMRSNGRAISYSVYATPQFSEPFAFDITKNGVPWQAGITAAVGGQPAWVELPADALLAAGDRIGIKLSMPLGVADEQAGVTIDVLVRYQ